MSNNTFRTFKLFWDDQDQEQEQWLRQMAREGWHLQHVSVFGRWTFAKGEPADIVYRLDFNDQGSNSAYHRLFQDAGWEHAADIAGRQYWRKRSVNGQAPEIFTDSESMVGKYRRLLALFALAMAMTMTTMLIMLLSNDKKQLVQDVFSSPMLALSIGSVIVIVPLSLYASLRLLKRISQVRNASA